MDFEFVRIDDITTRIDDLLVPWERDGRISTALAQIPPAPPQIDFRWIEDRFRVWVHHGATKIARGELYEVIGFLAHLRETVLGPLVRRRNRRLLQGVQRLETADPESAAELRATLCGRDAAEAVRALAACVELYRRWTDEADVAFDRRRRAEALAVQFSHDVAGHGTGPSGSPTARPAPPGSPET
ncbi:hypothetical protein [Kineococcus esterisolvens]|uniref:hypothetical protein n=1 Tax=unclassified Kineococcus TaxID=2621656 RepID=UPI003D7D8C68